MESIEGIPEISSITLKNLGDKSYDRRKSSAQEITVVVSKFYKEGNEEKLKKVLTKLQIDYLRSPNANYRNGALVTFAAIAIALDTDIVNYFPLFLNPVLKCLEDSDSKVRYYSSEALYNIAKAAHSGIINYFDRFFYALCQLFADVDTDVKKGASLLDRLLKEIVTETKVIDLSKFIPLFKQYITMSNPYTRRLVVSWISVLDSKPGVDMIDYFPQLMEGLFLLLGDEHREIRVETDDILQSFLSEIKSSEPIDGTMNSMINVLLNLVHHNNRFIRLTAVTWIYEFVMLMGWTIPYARLFRVLLPCYADNEKEVKEKAQATCWELLKSLRNNGGNVELLPLTEVVCTVLSRKHSDQCLVCLDVVSVLLEIRGNEVIAVKELRDALMNTLKEKNDEVIDCDLRVLVKYVQYSQELTTLIRYILGMLEQDEQYLEDRGCLIIRTLCKYINSEEVFSILSTSIAESSNKRFASLFVQMMNVILLTADETADMCKKLQSCFSATNPKPEGQQIFNFLFPAWSLNPFAALALCWFTEDYEVAYGITQSLASEELTLAMLLQADKLVQMLESPVFVHVRLQLLNAGSPSLVPLLQSLYGLLMILPQSNSYRLLQNRLSGIMPMHIILQNCGEKPKISEKDAERIALFKEASKDMMIQCS